MATSAEEFRRKLQAQPDPLAALRRRIEEAVERAVQTRKNSFSVDITSLPVNAQEPVAQEYRQMGWDVSVSNFRNERYLNFTLP